MINKIILMGRLTKDVELRQAGDTSVAKYTLAVNRSFKREGQPDVDFINCVAFGKSAEFAEKYFQKGQQVAVVGRIQTGNYTNKEGIKVYTTDVIVEEQHFADSKKDGGGSPSGKAPEPIDESDEDLPF